MATEHVMAMDSPLGTLLLTASPLGIRTLTFASSVQDIPGSADDSGEPSVHLQRAASQLREYFEGRRQRFDLPLDLRGTDFDRKAWEVLTSIAYGQTLSYREQALRLGHPQAARAVGKANGRNPLLILIPCHRVIASSGTLGGYRAGESTKRALLTLETTYGH